MLLVTSIVFVVRSPLFTLKPRVDRSGKLLEITTPVFGRAASAFSYHRSVSVDGRRRTVRLVETNAWFFTTIKQLKFEEIDHIAYSFSSLWTSWDWLGRVHDLVEAFTVSLMLKNSEELRVARYLGHGAVGDFSTWMMGDDLFDTAGTQEDDSRLLVEHLVEVLQVPLGPPGLAPRADHQVRMWKCIRCGRSVAPKPTCLYCGGSAAPSADARSQV